METRTQVLHAGIIGLSGKAVVSDPCYSRGGRGIITDLAVKPGNYAAYIILAYSLSLGVKIAAIAAVRADYIERLTGEWEPHDCVVGVDSGQCGIFDDSVYPAAEEPNGEYDDESTFYGECCKLTLSDAKCGILKSRKGFVSSTAFGDGSYELLCQYKDGERIALVVNYDCINRKALMEALLNSRHTSDYL